VFDGIIEKAKTDYNMLCEDEKHFLAEVQQALSQAMTEKDNIASYDKMI